MSDRSRFADRCAGESFPGIPEASRKIVNERRGYFSPSPQRRRTLKLRTDVLNVARRSEDILSSKKRRRWALCPAHRHRASS
ncbi:protein of unknown function [Methylocaldum szegediense]|uniref:Uncharacterized protein n=1 Tax=Methylocaldum szegediense TaxID=73780 RepID=A0ABN8XAA3_9GAMM|nr:protein of unknown function [Methylocaldum szegediense]